MSFWWYVLGGGLIGVGYQMGKDRGRMLQVGRALLVVGVLVLGAGAVKDFWPKPSVAASFFDVQIAYTQEEKLMLTGKTTLPDGTKICSLILRLAPERKGLYMDGPLNFPEATDVVVFGGEFTSWFPSVYEKGLKAGDYGLQIGILPDQAALLGPKNSWLSGSGVTMETNGHKSFAWETTFETHELPAHKTP